MQSLRTCWIPDWRYIYLIIVVVAFVTFIIMWISGKVSPTDQQEQDEKTFRICAFLSSLFFPILNHLPHSFLILAQFAVFFHPIFCHFSCQGCPPSFPCAGYATDVTTDIQGRSQNLRHFYPGMGLKLGSLGFSRNQNNRGSSGVYVICIYCGLSGKINAH